MKQKTKNIHIAIIIAGIVFNCISIFHSNIWFDEAYSVGLASKSFADIWKIGGNDVHPVLYYWILHIIYLLTNGSIIAYRIFSAICVSLLGILGYTHIRKDFDEKVGALFSFFAYFLPITCIYAVEVRMYSLAIVLVTVLAIYAYRLSKKEQDTNKNWLIFAITSLMCIYVHYYGLMAAGIINCVLLGYLIKQKRKTSIVKILVSGVIQLIAYIPWILYLIGQMKHVATGFWIGFEFPKTLFELLGAQFSGNVPEVIGFIFTFILFGYLGYKSYKIITKNKIDDTNKSKEINKTETLQNTIVQNNANNKTGLYALLIYIAVIIAALAITLLLDTSILYYRYLYVITGLYIFFISFYLVKNTNKYILTSICGITIILAIASNFMLIKEVYDKSNQEPITYLKQNIQPNDVIVFEESNFGTGSVVSLNFTDNKQFYYNPSDWGIVEAYKAFGEQLEVYTNTDFLDKCTDRVWIIDSPNSDYYNKVFNNDDFEVLSRKIIETKYEGYIYNMILVQRKNITV